MSQTNIYIKMRKGTVLKNNTSVFRMEVLRYV